MTPATLQRSYRRAGLACVVAAMIGGAVVLCGWVLTLPALTDWLGTGLSTQPNTAAGIVLLGAALVLRTMGRPRLAIGCALLVAGVGLATLVQYRFKTDLGIDQLLVRADWGQHATASPGRMGPPAAIMFMLLGIACALSTGSRRARKAAALTVLACMGIASLSIIGNFYGAYSLFVIPALTAIALITAWLLALLSIGLLLTALPDVEPVRTLASDSAAGALVRRALPVLILVPVLIGALRWKGQESGLFDSNFGTALRTIAEVFVLMALLWWMARAVARYEQRHRRSEAALRTSQQRYHSFIRLSSEGIWRCELEQPMPIGLPPDEAVDWMHRHGYLAEANEAMARMYGHADVDSLAGARLTDLVPRTPANDAYLRAFVASGFRLLGGESEERDGQGTTVHFSNNLVGVVENGLLLRAWGTQRDISARKRAESDLLATKEQLERMDRRKDEFLATLAHELRNPLAPLTTGMDLLMAEETTTADETRQVHRMMRRQLEHMVRLLDDLMDINRINRGLIGLRTGPVDLTATVHAAVESVRPAMRERDHALTLDLPTAPLHVEGDSVRLAQVVLNLLTNAAKYTPPGGRVHLSARSQDGHAVLEVQDNGIGLQPDQLTAIFEPFVQVGRTEGLPYGGLGIGLSLVKQLVELHDGTVTAHSAGPGQGMLFRVRLPLVSIPVPATVQVADKV